MEKIKIIDLLNKAAKGEEIPKKIICGSEVYLLEEGVDYLRKYGEDIEWFTESAPLFSTEYLNKEVEIVEEKTEEQVETSLEERLSKVERDLEHIQSLIK